MAYRPKPYETSAAVLRFWQRVRTPEIAAAATAKMNNKIFDYDSHVLSRLYVELYESFDRLPIEERRKYWGPNGCS